MTISRGSIVVVDLDPNIGHEKRGLRPCVAVSDPEVIGDQRFPMLCVIPVTGTPGRGLLYPQLTPGTSGLVKTSYALIDQVRSVDKRRIRAIYGELSAGQIQAIDEGLRAYLGLDARMNGS